VDRCEYNIGMKTFDVEVARVSYGFAVIRVVADNEDDAKDKALNLAGDYEYSEKSADYEVESVADRG